MTWHLFFINPATKATKNSLACGNSERIEFPGDIYISQCVWLLSAALQWSLISDVQLFYKTSPTDWISELAGHWIPNFLSFFWFPFPSPVCTCSAAHLQPGSAEQQVLCRIKARFPLKFLCLSREQLLIFTCRFVLSVPGGSSLSVLTLPCLPGGAQRAAAGTPQNLLFLVCLCSSCPCVS